MLGSCGDAGCFKRLSLTMFIHSEEILSPMCMDGQDTNRGRWDGRNDFYSLQGKLGNVVFQRETNISNSEDIENVWQGCCSCFFAEEGLCQWGE